MLKRVFASIFGCLMILGVPAAAQQQTLPAGNFCKSTTPGLKRTDALDCPSKHAWDLFVMVNHPALDPTRGRGIPDEAKKLGAVGSVSVWETWRLAGGEVFKSDGSEPPNDFNDLSLPGGPTTGKVPEPPKHIAILQHDALAERRVEPLFSPSDGIFNGHGGFGETRTNRPMYEFILSEKLYNLNGQQQYARDVIAGKRATISFPPNSMEVKAAWLELTPDQISQGRDKTFYVADYQGKKYGLTALHILTKDLPNWFWATFHHKDQPDGGVGTPDVLGPPAEISGTVWENYKLGGTQADFLDQTGAATKLSDYHIEFGFTDSSCMSCHARAWASPNYGPEFSGLPASVVLGPLRLNDYRDANGKLKAVPLDFVFSIPFRARWSAQR
jgi:hypothetical protein